MAQTTIELRRLLNIPGFQLFDFTYQVDDPNFKAQLEESIIDYYYDMEIAFETPDMFKRKFKARWLRTINYYNKLYNTTLLEYNPLINSKMSEALEQLATATSSQDTKTTSKGSGESQTDGTTGSTSTTVLDSESNSSDYPQQPIAGGSYLAGAATTDSNSTTTSEGTSGATTTSNDESSGTALSTNESTNNSEYTKTIEGLTGTSYQALIAQERENILRILDMVINEMKPCFMMVY